MTTAQMRNRTKTVTRRLGWDNLKPGDVLLAIEKGQGLRKGEHVKPIGKIRIESVTREPLCSIRDYPPGETAKEGFPDMTPDEFIRMFCMNADHLLCGERTKIRRIEFAHEPCEAPKPPKETQVEMSL